MFDLKRRGVDYTNPHGIEIEMKESFIDDIKNVRFAVYDKDLDSDYILFIYCNEYYLVPTCSIADKYEFNKGLCQPSLNTVIGLSCEDFASLEDAKEFIDNIQYINLLYNKER